MDQIGTAAGVGGIEVADLQAQIIDHRHHPARGVAGAEIAVDIGLGQAGVFQRALGDFGMELCGGFIGCVPGRMLVDPGEVGLALDGQVVLRWRFFFAAFSGLSGGLGKRPKYSVRRRRHGMPIRLRIPAARRARVMQEISRPMEGVGNAGRSAPQPRVQVVESTRVSHREAPDSIRHSRTRMVLTVSLRDLPGDRACLSPSLGGNGCPPSGSQTSANLTPASRRQDHTTSPSASGTLVSSAACVHRIPPQRS